MTKRYYAAIAYELLLILGSYWFVTKFTVPEPSNLTVAFLIFYARANFINPISWLAFGLLFAYALRDRRIRFGIVMVICLEIKQRESYTGKLNVCMDCDYFTTIDKGAEIHSREKKHFVIQDLVRDLPLGKEAVEMRRQMFRELRD